jgi:hypothetical protein
MYQKLIETIQILYKNNMQILPAILGITITGSLLFYFCKNFERSKSQVILLSFLLMISGFALQIFVNNIGYINSFMEKGNNIFSLPIVSAISGTFVVNRLLKYISDNKEKREVAILLVETINSQIRSLSLIECYISGNLSNLEKDIPEVYLHNIRANENLINIYKKNLSQNKYLEVAFSKIGIFGENEIQTICSFVTSLSDTLCYLEKINILDSSTIDSSIKLSIWALKSCLLKTILMGFLAVYQLNFMYTKKDYLSITNEFVDDYEKILEPLLILFKYPQMYYKINPDSGLMIDVINNLKHIRLVFNKLNKLDIKKEKNSICRINIKSISEEINHTRYKAFNHNQVFILPNNEFIYFKKDKKDAVTTDIESNAKNQLTEFMKKNINDYNQLAQNSKLDLLDLNVYINKVKNITPDKITVEVITPWGK